MKKWIFVLSLIFLVGCASEVIEPPIAPEVKQELKVEVIEEIERPPDTSGDSNQSIPILISKRKEHKIEISVSSKEELFETVKKTVDEHLGKQRKKLSNFTN